MRAVFGLVLIVGVALAGGAVMMAKNYIAAYQTELARERQARAEAVPTVDVLVATRPLRYGQRLDEDAVRIVRWPETSVPKDTFRDLETLFPEGTSRGRYVIRAMEPDEPIMAVKVTKPGEDAGITSRLERGQRAFAIKVDVATGVSGFLRPGDVVDVYWTGNTRGVADASGGDVTRLIQTRVRLIAIDQSASDDTNGTTIARTVTVAASPAEVAALAQAQSTGRLSLSLVGANDDTIASAIEIDQRALLGIEDTEAAPVRPKDKVCTIRTRRGAEVMDIPIPCTN